jgi:hypothetical protein
MAAEGAREALVGVISQWNSEYIIVWAVLIFPCTQTLENQIQEIDAKL